MKTESKCQSEKSGNKYQLKMREGKGRRKFIKNKRKAVRRILGG